MLIVEAFYELLLLSAHYFGSEYSSLKPQV